MTKPLALLLCMIAAGAVVLHAGASSACEPVFAQGAAQVADYASGRGPGHAVFVGRVTAVEERRFAGAAAQTIRMEVLRWLSGDRPETVVTVSGGTGVDAGAGCAGRSDFYAKVGQQWLVFGQRDAGTVNPDAALSRLAPTAAP